MLDEWSYESLQGELWPRLGSVGNLEAVSTVKVVGDYTRAMTTDAGEASEVVIVGRVCAYGVPALIKSIKGGRNGIKTRGATRGDVREARRRVSTVVILTACGGWRVREERYRRAMWRRTT